MGMCTHVSRMKIGGKIVRKLIKIISVFLMVIISISIASAQENSTENATESPTVTEAPTPIETAVQEAKFRVGPTVRLRPLNSEIEKDKDGIVELFMNNPSLNDISLEVDMSISVPSGIYIYGEDGGMSGGAGTVVGHFSVPPGSSRTITLHIKGTDIGNFPVHFSGMYWPDGDKDKWNPMSLDNSFKVLEPSADLDEDGIPKKEIPYSYILIGLILIIGIVLIVRRPPKTEVTIEE